MHVPMNCFVETKKELSINSCIRCISEDVCIIQMGFSHINNVISRGCIPKHSSKIIFLHEIIVPMTVLYQQWEPSHIS
jgi:hypothetical protein